MAWMEGRRCRLPDRFFAPFPGSKKCLHPGAGGVGDCAGSAQLEIERRNPGMKALFTADAGGNVNPLPRRAVELATITAASLTRRRTDGRERAAPEVGPGANTMVLGCFNDVLACIPNERVLREGGYEGDTAHAPPGPPQSVGHRHRREIMASALRLARVSAHPVGRRPELGACGWIERIRKLLPAPKSGASSLPANQKATP